MSMPSFGTYGFQAPQPSPMFVQHQSLVGGPVVTPSQGQSTLLGPQVSRVNAQVHSVSTGSTNTNSTGTAAGGVFGDPVEVWSSTVQSWCNGSVQKFEDGLMYVNFMVPDGRCLTKAVPPNHPEIRLGSATRLTPTATTTPDLSKMMGTQTFGTTTLPCPQQPCSTSTARQGGVLVDTQEDLVEPALHAKRVTGFNRRALHGANIASALSGNEHGMDPSTATKFESNPQASQVANTIVRQAMLMAQSVSEEPCDVFDKDWLGPNGQDALSVLFNNGNNASVAESLEYLSSEVAQIFASQPTLVEAEVPAKIYGDLHGQLRDMLLLLFHYGFPQSSGPSFVFNGDWADRGRHQVEVVSLVFALKVMFPNRVVLLRGNHEDAAQNQFMGPVGFEHACLQRFGPQGPRVFGAVSQAFNYLPLGCLVGKRILVVHGGIGSGQWTLNELAARQRPIDHDTIMSDDVVHNVLWSDPIPDDTGREEDVFGVHDSPRDGHAKTIFTFGKDVTDRFCSVNQVEMIVRSHQALARGFGYDVMHGGRCVRVFSARDYEGQGNDGAILSITEGGGHYLARAQVVRSLAVPKADATPLVCNPNATGPPARNPFFM